MDSSAPFPLFSSLRVVGDMNCRPFISPLWVPLMTTRPTVFSPLSQQQPAEIRPTSIEVAWPVTAGLGVRVIRALLPSPKLLQRGPQPLFFTSSSKPYSYRGIQPLFLSLFF
ncbi:hypothetical protein AVEN_2867-1 [Araneus ventricosus]|uniref:Uncharacterized protein n=1 Tax=Araneus ventricosus TaxID=182803 RepID=A0A4Y2PTX0_ARAVE|nr:hypothetical protein AVEN_2867-1 [Araneus ventricosus]